MLTHLVGIGDRASVLVPGQQVDQRAVHEPEHHTPTAPPIPEREVPIGPLIAVSAFAHLLTGGVPRREGAGEVSIAEVGLAGLLSVAMPHGDMAVGNVVAIGGFGRLDTGAISDETSVPLVGQEFSFLLLRAVRIPLRPEALLAAVDVGPLGERDAAAGPRRPHALAEAVLVLTFGALTPLPCRPAAVLEAVAILTLALLAALGGPYRPSTVLPAVAIFALFLHGARRMPRRVGPVALDAKRAGFLAPARVPARRTVAALAPAVWTVDRELSESDGITGVGVVDTE